MKHSAITWPLIRLIEKHGRQAAVDVLKSCGAMRVREVPKKRLLSLRMKIWWRHRKAVAK